MLVIAIYTTGGHWAYIPLVFSTIMFLFDYIKVIGPALKGRLTPVPFSTKKHPGTWAEPCTASPKSIRGWAILSLVLLVVAISIVVVFSQFVARMTHGKNTA
jgi:hypothetical protein